jgi:hypothetical protein
VYPSGHQEWWLHGKEYSEEEFLIAIENGLRKQ